MGKRVGLSPLNWFLWKKIPPFIQALQMTQNREKGCKPLYLYMIGFIQVTDEDVGFCFVE